MRQHGRRYIVRDRFLDGPSTLTGVRDPAFDVRQVGSLLIECALRELEEPRAHDASLQPDARDTLHVDLEFARVDELETLAVSLHHPVLDPVVDHLDEMARAALSEMRPAVRRRERVEHRPRALHRACLAADHHAVAVVESPDPPGDSDVEIVESLGPVFLRPPHRVAEIRVAPVDEYVTLTRVSCELVEGLIGGLPSGHHRPEDARGTKLLRHLLDRVGADGALGFRLIDRAGAAISRHDVVPAADQTRDHVAAHPAQAVQPDLHAVTPRGATEDIRSTPSSCGRVWSWRP